MNVRLTLCECAVCVCVCVCVRVRTCVEGEPRNEALPLCKHRSEPLAKIMYLDDSPCDIM